MTTADKHLTLARRVMGGLALTGLIAMLTACGGDDVNAGPTLRIQTATSISGATCTVTDASGKSLAASVTTSTNGSATFTNVASTSSLALVACTGGSYTDLASGRTLTAPRLRSYAASPSSTSGSDAAMVTPLTELAVRLLGTQSADAQYATTRGWVARGFGLDKIDIGSVAALDLSSSNAADDAASRHGLALAALSQQVLTGSSGATTEALITAFAANFDNNGYPKDMVLPMAYAHAVEAALGNSRLQARLAGAGSTVARELFDKAVHVEPLATIEYVDADDSPTDSGEALHVIEPGAPSTLFIGGRWMTIGLDVRLAGAECHLYDLQTDEQEESTGEQEVTAECPAQAAGKAMLVVRDAGVVVHQTEMTVQAVVRSSPASTGRARALAVGNTGTGPVTLSGTVTAIAPTVDTTTGAHNYATTRTFTVKGVVVELLDRDANGAVLRESSTDGEGKYSFAGVDAGRNVTVRVKAQLLKARAAGATTGAQWNLAVRDNTSTSSPKALYVLDSAPLTTVSTGVQTADLVAAVGFATDGTAGADAARQSAPFSILEVAYSAMTKIEVTDPNVVFPDVNFYWSTKNVGSDGNKEVGQIGTSHYADSGTLPGVFILGKADVDTDEFDQGVIGHEFGHWLQSVLSASDNPGGSHAGGDFKDASLAYGEGYGTAVGGLLAGSPFYIDTSGVKQSGGGVTNLDQPTANVRKGFYAEESVQYVMYQIGKRHGFSAFWNAVTAMKGDHYSSTVFAFLARFIAANPAALVADLLTTENIRTTDPLGRLPTGAAPDPAIVADQNKGTATIGAGDLETLYLPVTLATVSAGTEPVALTPTGAPNFCINHNLKGAKLSNGLGMLKRFTFVAPYSGSMGIKLADDKGAALDGKDTTVSARSDRGGKVRANEWGEAVQIPVQQGATYTLLFQQTQANVFQGSRCGNTMTLWRMPA